MKLETKNETREKTRARLLSQGKTTKQTMCEAEPRDITAYRYRGRAIVGQSAAVAVRI